MSVDGWSLVRFVHVTAAMGWVGGQLLLSAVVLPVLRRQLEPAARGPLVHAVARRFALAANAALLLMPFGRWGLRTTMRLVASGALPADTPQAQELADYLMLIHTHFRPRRERIPIFDDDALGHLDMPVLVIVGGRDRMLDSFGTRRRLERAMPHATVRLLPDAGHVLVGQTSVVLDFLRPR